MSRPVPAVFGSVFHAQMPVLAYREGTGWLYRIVHRIVNGGGRMEDLDLLESVGNNMAGRTICALADAAVFPVRGFTKHFRNEFVHYIEHGGSIKPHKWN